MVNIKFISKLNSVVFFVIFPIIKTLCHRLIPAFRIKECLELYVNQQAGGKAFPLFDDRSSLLVLPKFIDLIKKEPPSKTKNSSKSRNINFFLAAQKSRPCVLLHWRNYTTQSVKNQYAGDGLKRLFVSF